MQSYRRLTCLLVLWLAGLAGVAHAQGGFALREGDRVVFYGDSITDQRLYTTFVEDYVVTRFPEANRILPVDGRLFGEFLVQQTVFAMFVTIFAPAHP